MKINEHQKRKVNERFWEFTRAAYSERDLNKALENEDRIGRIVGGRKPLLGFVEDVRLFFSMLKDWTKGDYRRVPVRSVVAIVLSLLYVLAPADIVPDFIPFVGFVDDATILSLLIRFCKADLEAYKSWHEGR